MHCNTFFTYLLLTSTTGWAQYTLQQDYFAGGNFLNNFEFFTGADPTEGFVEYVDQGTAQAGGLVTSSAGQVRIGVNDRDVTTTGRQSVRLTSRQSYQSGLVVLDLAHMPGGICGTWPAFWMVGPNWPTQGEIDIIEGVNDQQTNQMTLHTGNTCSIGGAQMLGQIASSNCDVSSGDNTGCPITTTDRSTYGAGFNANGGGTYATEWTGSAISVYFFPRGQEPADLTSGRPNPATWGEPMAHFSGGCDIAQSFTNQQIVFDTTFCGQWAGAVWDGSSCAQSTGTTCEAFVGQNPSAFRDAYWTINGLKVYSGNGAAAPGPSGGPIFGSGSAQSTFVRSTVPAGRPSGAPFAPAPSGSPPQGSGFPQGPSSPSGQAPPPQAPAPSQAPPPGQFPAPSTPPQFSSPPEGSSPPGFQPGHFRHRHGRPPAGEALVATNIETVVVTVTVPQVQPRETGSSNDDALSRHRRHLEHHRHAHGFGKH